MVWIIDGIEYSELEDAVSAVIDGIDEDQYEEFLDGAYGDISVCGIEYAAGKILKEVDPTAFRCGFSDWTDSIRDEVSDRLESMDEGDDEEIFGVDVEVPYSEDDEDEDEDEGDEDEDEDDESW